MPSVYPIEPYPDEMDQARDFLIRQDEECQPGYDGATGTLPPPEPTGRTVAQVSASAADPDKLLAEFAELLLHINAARFVS